MNGEKGYSRRGSVLLYQHAGSLAVRTEMKEVFNEAAVAWLRAAALAPCARWRRFAQKRARYCRQRCRRKA